jgi:crossover junction endodeoxyribonuclease RuvC
MPSVYLGVDPGIADMGYGVIAVADGKERCLAYGSIRTDKAEPMERRLLRLREEFSALLAKYRPTHVGIEKLFFQKNVRTAIVVAEARGVLRLCLAEAGVPYREFSPQDTKIAVCGTGSAEKGQVQRMVCTLLALPELPKPDDAADALALALAVASTVRFAEARVKE